MPKNTKRRSPSQITRDRRKIAEMYLQGRYQEEIATALGIDQTTVSRDIKHLLDNWQQETEVDIKQHQAELEQKYLWVWREAAAAWLKSKEDAETTIQELIEAGEGEGTNGKGRLKVSTRKEGQSGNPALLAQAQAALKALREMFGTDAAIKQRQVNLNIDFSQLTDEQVARIAGGEDPLIVVSNPGPGRIGTAAATGPDSDSAESMAG